MDYRKQRAEHASIHIDRAVVLHVEGVHITKDLSWYKHTNTVLKRARQRLFPLSRLKRFGMWSQIFSKFYSCTIENILTGFITAWYGNCSASNLKTLQRVVRTA
jgi:hypothetical protein